MIGNCKVSFSFRTHPESVFQFSVQFQFFFSFLCFSTFWHLNNLRPVGEKLFYFRRDGFKSEKGEKPEWILFIWDLWLKKILFLNWNLGSSSIFTKVLIDLAIHHLKRFRFFSGSYLLHFTKLLSKGTAALVENASRNFLS